MRKRTLLIIAVVATLAGLLFGSAATAGNLITSKQVKDHSLKVKDLRKSAVNKLRGHNGVNGVNGVDGKNGVNGKDGAKGDKGDTGATGAVGPRGLTGPQGPQGEPGLDGADSTVPGPMGPQGPEGPEGPAGKDGVDGASGTANVHVVSVTTPNDNATASCPAGETLLGGGGEATGPNAYLVYSKPVGSTWAVKSKTSNNTSAYAVCAA